MTAATTRREVLLDADLDAGLTELAAQGGTSVSEVARGALRAVVTREAPIYSLDGNGPSLVRDAWRARTENDFDALDRLDRFRRQQADIGFVATTANTGAVVPPGYRPGDFEPVIAVDRPLVSAATRAPLADGTPFTLPGTATATGATANHVEGTNPAGCTLAIAPVTVTPGGISGLFELTREIADSSNPAIDAIAMQAMQESYSQQTETKVYAELNGANGQGGTITAGFVPSGAQVVTSAVGTLPTVLRESVARYGFRAGRRARTIAVSEEAAVAVADLDSTEVWLQDVTVAGAPAMTGNAAGDADVLVLSTGDLWAWESPTLTFRYEERNGPARIDLALFGYFAARLVRPRGLAAIRYTAV